MKELTVLVIEDDEFVSAFVSRLLKNNGFNVLTAFNGKEGLDCIMSGRSDFVLCDRNMPVMSGYTLLKTLREDHPEYDDLPFIFLTALDDPRDMDSIQYLKPSGYLTKPVSSEQLVEAITLIASGEQTVVSPPVCEVDFSTKDAVEH